MNLGWKTENAWAATLEKREKAGKRRMRMLRSTGRVSSRICPPAGGRHGAGHGASAQSYKPLAIRQTSGSVAYPRPDAASACARSTTHQLVAGDKQHTPCCVRMPRHKAASKAIKPTSHSPKPARVFFYYSSDSEAGTTILKKITSRITPKNTTKTTSMLITTYLLYCTNLLYPAQACNLQLTRMSRR